MQDQTKQLTVVTVMLTHEETSLEIVEVRQHHLLPAHQGKIVVISCLL